VPNKMRAYISGPMSGIHDFNFEAFDDAAFRLRNHGYRVVNPADFGADPKHSWKDCLCRDLAMLAHVDIVATLPNWHLSRGASLEVHVAREMEIPVRSVIEILQSPSPERCPVDTLAVETESRMRKLLGWTLRWKGR